MDLLNNTAAGNIPEPRTAFTWPVYADATLAGLSVLIPIPLVDWLFERFFRQRMPVTITRYRGRRQPPEIVQALNRSSEGCLGSCLLLPFKALLIFIMRLSRKILYFLTVKEATDQLSYYWHQAFLIDYMLLAGHLDNEASTEIARAAMDQVLAQTGTSPLTTLAWSVVRQARHLLRTLLRARRGEEDELIHQEKTFLAAHWSDLEPYLRELAGRYYLVYEQLKRQPETG
jgi:hypothetical protein